MRKIVIVYLVSSLGRTGPTKQLYNLVKYLDKSIFDINIITLSPENRRTYISDFRNLDISLTSLNQSRLAGVFIAVPTLKRIFSLLNPDIIHTQGIRSDIVSTFFKKYRIRYSTQRNDPFVDYTLQYGRFFGYLLGQFHIAAFKKIPHVIACSNTIFQENNLRGLKCSYICNGVDFGWGQKILSRSEKLDIRKELDLDVTGSLFVLIGPVIKRKDIDVAVRAMVDHFQDNRVSLCILGSGPLLNYCKSIANGQPNIIFRGFVEDVDRYLMAADALLSASRSEGIPNSILEALAWGVPLVASNISAHREILRVDPRAGAFFRVGDSDDLARAIQNFRFDPTSSTAARKIVQKSFNAELLAYKYQEHYLKLVNQPL